VSFLDFEEYSMIGPFMQIRKAVIGCVREAVDSQSQILLSQKEHGNI
jgi:hypothetical protein